MHTLRQRTQFCYLEFSQGTVYDEYVCGILYIHYSAVRHPNFSSSTIQIIWGAERGPGPGPTRVRLSALNVVFVNGS